MSIIYLSSNEDSYSLHRRQFMPEYNGRGISSTNRPIAGSFFSRLNPDEETDPMAIEVMSEIGIDISTKKPKSFHLFEGLQMDYLITICDGTKDKISPVDILYKHKIHLGFNDPRKATSFETGKIETYREIRDEIRNELDYFYTRILARELI